MEQTRENFIQSLSDLGSAIDPPVEVFINSRKTYGTNSCIPVLLLKPLTQIPEAWETISKSKAIVATLIPIAVTAGSGFLGNLITKWETAKKYLTLSIGPKQIDLTDFPITVSAAVIGFLAWYFIQCRAFYTKKMVDITDKENFHVDAYRRQRPKEYEMFNGFVDESFSYSILKDFVSQVLAHGSDSSETIQKVLDAFMNQERQAYHNELETSRKEFDQLQAGFNIFIEESRELLEESIRNHNKTLTSTIYLTDLLKTAATSIFRMHKGMFNFDDLQVVSGFTLYELRDMDLYKIADHGTTGSSPDRIYVNDPQFKDWAVVQAARSGSRHPLQNEPNADKLVVSFALKMDNGVRWIYNYHIHISTNPKAVALTTGTDVETSVLYNLVHAMCLHLQRSGKLSRKGGTSNVGN